MIRRFRSRSVHKFGTYKKNAAAQCQLPISGKKRQEKRERTRESQRVREKEGERKKKSERE